MPPNALTRDIPLTRIRPTHAMVASAIFATCSGASAIAGDPPCLVECPEGAILEGEACTPGEIDNFNGGCNSNEEPFIRLACGDVLCGSVYAVNGMRDTDWFDLQPESDVLISATISAEFPVILVGLAETSGCDPLYVFDQVQLDPCETGTLTLSDSTPAGAIAWVIPLVDGFEGLPCEGSDLLGTDFVMSITCAAPPLPPCPTLGDANADGFVDFDDLLLVLANFGDCP